MTDKMEAVAEFYGYSLRRLYDKIVQGKVLGIKHECGKVIYFNSGDYVMMGTISDIPQDFILPKGTKMLSHSVCSGEVTGTIFQGDINRNKHPTVTLMGEPGCSGIVVGLTGMT